MTAHDMIIDNASGAVVRADLNVALAALSTLQAGTSAPSSPLPNQFWYDTANAVLKQRDNANTVWNQITFPTQGTGEIVLNEAGADMDFRVEGDTVTNLFHVDAGADAVNINGNLNLGGDLLGSKTGGSVIRSASASNSSVGIGGKVTVVADADVPTNSMWLIFAVMSNQADTAWAVSLMYNRGDNAYSFTTLRTSSSISIIGNSTDGIAAQNDQGTTGRSIQISALRFR